MDLASCWTPSDLAPGPCSVESNEAVCFAFLSHKKPAIIALVWTTVCQTPQDSKGYKPLALLYKFIQPSSEFQKTMLFPKLDSLSLPFGLPVCLGKQWEERMGWETMRIGREGKVSSSSLL